MGSWRLPAQESSVAPGCFGESARKLDINRSGRAVFREGGRALAPGPRPSASRVFRGRVLGACPARAAQLA